MVEQEGPVIFTGFGITAAIARNASIYFPGLAYILYIIKGKLNAALYNATRFV
jgi:hypothetical protein